MEKMTSEKRSEIMDAAITLFSKKGFERTTVDEIAARANVGKGTIYLYFKNKEHIFLSIVEEGMYELQRLLQQIADQDDFLRQLRDMIYVNLKFVEDHKELYRMFMKERLSMRLNDDDKFKKRFMDIHHDLQQFTTQFVKKGMEKGVIHETDPGYLGMALSGIISHFAFHWLFTNDSQPFTNLTDTICTLFLKGAAVNPNLEVSGGVQNVS